MTFEPMNRVAGYFEMTIDRPVKKRRSASKVDYPIIKDSLRFEAGQRNIFNAIALYKAMFNAISPCPSDQTIRRAFCGEVKPNADALAAFQKFFGYSDPDSITQADHVERRTKELRNAGLYVTGKKPKSQDFNTRVSSIMGPMQTAVHDNLSELQETVADLWNQPRVGPLVSFLVHWLKEQSEQE